HDVFGDDLLIVCGFFLATACSACFWTLGGGSAIAGMVFTFAGEIAAASFVYFVASYFTTREHVLLLIMGTACPIYSALFFWLGWRQFCRLELKSTAVADFGGATELASGL